MGQEDLEAPASTQHFGCSFLPSGGLGEVGQEDLEDLASTERQNGRVCALTRECACKCGTPTIAVLRLPFSLGQKWPYWPSDFGAKRHF